MVSLKGATPHFDKEDFHGLQDVIPKLTRPRKRLTELLSRSVFDNPSKKQEELWAQGSKKWHLKLLRTPIEITPNSDNSQAVGAVKLGVNELYPQGEMNLNQSV